MTAQTVSPEQIDTILTQLEAVTQTFEDPLVTSITRKKRNPFQILIATILSLRTKDTITAQTSKELFARAGTPDKILALSVEELEQLIYPVGFYRRKAQTILAICQRLIDEYDGKVPADLDELLTFKGVGRKTANLVVTMAFGKPGICVDVHVARITQRIGIVPFKGEKDGKIIFHDPDRVEMILRKILPQKWWIPVNDILVRYGQNLCTPVSPKCSQCPISEMCARIGVEKHR